MSKSFEVDQLEKVVKEFDAEEWDRLLFTFKFKEIDEKMAEANDF